jgi:hypothetical protein
MNAFCVTSAPCMVQAFTRHFTPAAKQKEANSSLVNEQSKNNIHDECHGMCSLLFSYADVTEV